MQRTAFVLLLSGLFGTGTVSADTFDYEAGLSFGSSDSDTFSFAFVGDMPDPTQGSSQSSSSDDEITISGRWFYSGLSDETGPRSRAAFLSRASSVSLTYSRLDSDSVQSSNLFGFPFSAVGEGTADTFAVDARHVWKDSGWYLVAGIAQSEFDGSITDSNGNTLDSSSEVDVYLGGFGKYLGAMTTLDLIVVDADTGGSGDPDVAVTFSHIGDLGENWQYGADLGLTFAGDEDNREYDARFSLYPNRDLAFGFAYSRLDVDSGFDFDGSTLAGFASWFLNEKTVVRAELSTGDVDGPGFDADSDSFRLGVTMRF